MHSDALASHSADARTHVNLDHAIATSNRSVCNHRIPLFQALAVLRQTTLQVIKNRSNRYLAGAGHNHAQCRATSTLVSLYLGAHGIALSRRRD